MALIINGEEIDDEIVEGEFQQIKSHYEQLLQVSCCERDSEFRGYAKDNVIARVLLTQEAQKKFPDPSENEIQEAKLKLFEEHGGEDQFYMNMGIPYRDEELIVGNIQQSLRVEKLLAEVSAPLPAPNDDELKAFYEENIDDFLTAEEVRASHITKNMGASDSRDDVYAHLRKLRTELRNGADFDVTAKSENDDSSQDTDLGFFKRGDFMEEFETIAFSMDVGEISPVFSTHLGLHICKVTDRKAAEPKPLEDVKDAALDLLLSQHREKRVDAYVEEIRKDASIEDTDPDEE